jgi:ATP/maltotriose-dependent transcriptional regulator MalT
MTSPRDASRARATSRRLVGRDPELARLEAAYDEVADRHEADTLFVEGPAGIGKTRLVDAFVEAVGNRGGRVFVGHCLAEGEEILPYAPLVEVLGTVVREEGRAAVRRWAGPAAPELGRLLPTLAEHDGGSTATSGGSSRLFQALCAVLDGLSQRRPFVLVVEDLHWADRSTREMLALLAHQLRGGVLLLLTLRTDESPREPGMARFVAELGRRSDRHIVLQPLTREQQARQLSEILGVPPRRDLLDDVYRRAEGNPFFAEELLALGSDGRLPCTVRDLLLLRLDALAPATQQLLRTGSVLGRQFAQPLLEAVAGMSAERVEEALRPAVLAHVLVPTDGAGSGYVFRHALLQEAVAGTLLPGEAARMHRRVAEVLTASPTLGGGRAFLAGRIARHWHAAGDGHQALVASVSAAREAKQALAFSEALSHYERAIALLGTVPEAEALLDEPRYRLLWAAAEVAHLAAHPDRAAELVRTALDVVDVSQAHHHAYLYERLGRYLWMSADGHGALAAYENAVALVPAEPSRERAAVLSGYSQILMLAGRFAESKSFAEQAIEVAREVPAARSIEGHARCNLGVDLSRLGQHEDGVAELLEARRIAEEEFVDVDDVARAMVNLHSVQLYAGRTEEAAEVALESLAVVERLGLQRRKGVWCRCDAAHALVMLGRLDEAERLLDEAQELMPAGIDAVQTDVMTGRLLLRRGRLEDARTCLERARRDGARLLDGQLVAPLYAPLVEVAVEQGDGVTALSLAEEGAARLSADEDATFCVPLFAEAVRAAVAAGDVGAAQAWLARSQEAIARTAGQIPVALAHHAASVCEVAAAREEPDAGQWRDVALRWEEVADPYRAAYARLRAAEALLTLGARPAARDELLTAWTSATRIGAARLVARAEDLARRARLTLATGPAPVEEVPFRLTPREREVFLLVAEGLTDRDIGARLFISHRTVERHVSNLLAKVGADRRAELTATAHRLGLVAATRTD